LAAMCLVFAYCMMYGLPDYYRQVPPKVPHFLRTLFRRKLVLWFLASEILRDYWLSGPYGRNWAFLWSAPINKAVILALIILFFIVIWGILLVHFDVFLQVSYLAVSGIRSRIRCSSVVPDALGYILPCFIYPMGRECRALPRYIAVAVVGSIGRRPGCWSWHDLATDTFSFARVRHPRFLPSYWIYCRHGSESHGT